MRSRKSVVILATVAVVASGVVSGITHKGGDGSMRLASDVLAALRHPERP